MKEIKLAEKKVLFEKSPVIFKYKPDENWENFFEIKSGEWLYKDGALIGKENGNKGGILFLKQYFNKDVMLCCKCSTILPATRDLNAVWAAHWDDKKDYLGESYVCGLNGWWENKAGIERNKADGLLALNSLYKYEPGKEINMVCGSANGHCFLIVDDVLVAELRDPFPHIGGHVGFSAYCTMLKITVIEVREVVYEDFYQTYIPEF